MSFVGDLLKKKDEEVTRSRTFTYALAGVTLSFTLDLANKEEMARFEKLLLLALDDVREEMNKKP